MIKRKQSIIFVVLMLGLLTMVGVIGVVKTGEKKTPLPLEENAVDLPEASLPEGSGQKQNETSAGGRGKPENGLATRHESCGGVHKRSV